MNTSQIIVTVIITLLTTAALAVGSVWAMWPKAAEASISVAAQSGIWHGGRANRSEHGGFKKDGFKARCAHMSPAHLELGSAVVSAALDLDDSQEAELAPIEQSLESLRAFTQSTCESVDIENFDSSLDSLQAMLTETAATVGMLKPQLSAFYASLTPEQQEKLHNYMSMHHARHGRRGGWGHRAH